MNRLENKIALVTGGNSGIGFATAKRFIDDGAEVVITGRRPDAVAAAVSELGPRATGIVADAGKLADIDRMVEEIRVRHGRIDVLFLNAGIAPVVDLAGQSEEDFDQVFETNVKGPYFTLQKALPLMQAGTSVILNASIANSKGIAGMSVYSASKAALRSLARTLTAELAPLGIRINVLSPGPIETPLFSKLGKTEQEVEAMAEQFAQMVPMGRFGKPEEMAGAVSFLASSDSAYVSGLDLAADGGTAQV